VTVLDASAVVALLYGEPGAKRVEEVIADSLIGAANFSEAMSIVALRNSDTDAAAALLANLGMTIVPVTESQAMAAANLHIRTKKFGLSLGDRLCLALAFEAGLAAITSDKIWANLDLGVEIRIIR